MYSNGKSSRETTYVRIGSVWMTTWVRHVLSTKNRLQVNNYNIYRAPKARKLDHLLNFTVTQHNAMVARGNVCVNENQIREQTKQGRRTP